MRSQGKQGDLMALSMGGHPFTKASVPEGAWLCSRRHPAGQPAASVRETDTEQAPHRWWCVLSRRIRLITHKLPEREEMAGQEATFKLRCGEGDSASIIEKGVEKTIPGFGASLFEDQVGALGSRSWLCH